MKKTTIKRIGKIITIFLIVATIISCLSMVLGTGDPLKDIKGNTDFNGATTVRNVANRILGIIQIICYVAAIVLLIFLGIKFATASPEGKSTVKNSAIIYVVGAILIFAAGSILGVINKIGTETINASSSNS